MIYFYAILGVGMFSSIFSLLQISTSIVKQQTYFRPSGLNSELNHKSLDRDMLSMLNSPEFNALSPSLGNGVQLCTEIKANAIAASNPLDPTPALSNHSALLSNYQVDSNFLVDQNGIINSLLYYRFFTSCALNRQGQIRHRVILSPPDAALNINTFSMYSCILNNGLNESNRCIFENVKQDF